MRKQLKSENHTTMAERESRNLNKRKTQQL